MSIKMDTGSEIRQKQKSIKCTSRFQIPKKESIAERNGYKQMIII